MDRHTLALHTLALRSSGYTTLKAVVDRACLSRIATAADRALDHTMRIFREHGKVEGINIGDDYHGTRCFYTWSPDALALLEIECVHAIAAAVMGEYHLWDLSLLSVPPAVSRERTGRTSWHRDMGCWNPLTEPARFLHCFLCIDKVTPENGAPWVIPGSQFGADFGPELEPNRRSFDNDAELSMAIQITGEPGDILIFHPTLLHAPGFNATQRPRRMVNIGLCHRKVAPMADHWSIAGCAAREHASAASRTMLDPGRTGLPTTWGALPPEWV